MREVSISLSDKQRRWLNRLVKSEHIRIWCTQRELGIVKEILIRDSYTSDEQTTLKSIADYYRTRSTGTFEKYRI